MRYWLAETRPEAVVVFCNDHGLTFFLDNMPTFAGHARLGVRRPWPGA